MVKSSEIFFLPEDTYGIPFVKNLIKRLKDEGFLSSDISIAKAYKLPGKCNPKLSRIIKAAYDDYDRIIILADAEGSDVTYMKRKLENHVPSPFEHKVRIIILKYCIEEWVCIGLNIRFRHNPIEALKNYVRRTRGAKKSYEKYMLPSFVPKLDLNRLSSYSSFREFLGTLLS